MLFLYDKFVPKQARPTLKCKFYRDACSYQSAKSFQITSIGNRITKKFADKA